MSKRVDCEQAHKEHINRYKMAHNIGVAEYMRENAEKYHLSPDEMYVLGLLHDIGYLSGRVGHEKVGADILNAIGLNQNYVYAIKYHGLNPKLIEEKPYDSFDFETAYKDLPELVLLYEADMSIDARGYRVGFKARLDDIGQRYGYDSIAYKNASDTVDYVKRQLAALNCNSKEQHTFTVHKSVPIERE